MGFLVAFPGVREKAFEFAGLEVGEAAEDITEVLPDVEVVAEGTGNDGVDDGSGAAAAGTAEEEPIFAAGGDVLHSAFHRVVVDRQVAVVDEAAEFLPLIKCIGDCFADG